LKHFSLNPGLIDTGLAEKSGMDPSFLRNYKSKIPMQRFGSPDEVASVALFLASDDTVFVTGTGIVIDGGQLAEE
jgi:NAD(P)-dependent dehydrogenase (short-subunit alcohol dehydrogenase family)